MQGKVGVILTREPDSRWIFPMADFAYLTGPDWNYHLDIIGGTVTKRTATRLEYTSTTGLTVILRGTGFA